jgi:hypothetical protein
MIQEMTLQSYRGVLCRHCRQPIPLPAIVIKLETAAEKDPEKPVRAFHIRCRACENEHMYKSTDIADFEGTPRPRRSRGRFAHAPSRRPGGLAKAAHA